MKNILLVFEDIDEAENIEEIIRDDLQKILKQPIETTIKRNKIDAIEQLAFNEFDLIILDFQFPIKKKSSKVIRGLDFLSMLSGDGKEIPSIIVVTLDTTSNKLFEATEKLYQCRVIIKGKEDFEPTLLRACQTLIEKQSYIRRDNYAVITIKLNVDDNIYTYTIDAQYGERKYQDAGILDISRDTINKLLRKSPRIEELSKNMADKKENNILRDMPDISEIVGKMDSFYIEGNDWVDRIFNIAGAMETKALREKERQWEIELQEVGEKIVEEIIMNNRKFSRNLYRLQGRVGNSQNVRFLFDIGREIHSIHWEAMFEEDESPPYYMLKSPIYRKLPVSGEYNPPLFDQINRIKNINVLIIKSDVAECVPALNQSFPNLNNILIETGLLYKFLNKNREHLRIGKIKIIDSVMPIEGSPNLIKEAKEKGDWVVVENDFLDAIQEILRKEDWDLVHYAGHSYYDKESEKGYVILPGQDYPIALEIEKFSAFLRTSRTKFVFLSSCHSSEEDFVYELAGNGIPSIIGFRWDLDDRLAAKYALKFYHNLFLEKNSVEVAFLQTRIDMYALHKDAMIWASPMLIKQC